MKKYPARESELGPGEAGRGSMQRPPPSVEAGNEDEAREEAVRCEPTPHSRLLARDLRHLNQHFTINKLIISESDLNSELYNKYYRIFYRTLTMQKHAHELAASLQARYKTITYQKSKFKIEIIA